MQEWLTSAQNPPTDEKDISALQLKDTVVQKAASMLGVVLNPLPAQARQAFPKETLKRMQYAFDTIDRWRSQVHDGLLGDAYLQSHYLIGETVGYLRRFLATNYRPSESAQSVVNKVVSVANEEMASSQVDMSEQLRAQWLDIVDKLKALDKLSPETAVSLRSRLGSWYWAFLTELNGKPL